MILPNMIVCGAQRSGTTSLYHYLAQHPQIYMAPAKEIHYFSRHYDEGLAWYARQFTGATDEIVIGEASPSYMDHEKAPARMANAIPSAKLLFLLRNPIDRALSAYQFALSFSQDPGESFSQAIRTEKGFASYVARGFYYQYLTRYLSLFRRESILVLFTENLRESPEVQLRRAYTFLQVDPDFRPNVTQRYNAAATAQSPMQLWTLRRWRQTKLILLRSGLISPEFRRQTSRFRATLGKFLFSDKDNDQPTISQEDTRYLATIYAEQDARLSELLGEELPWRFED